MLGQSVFIDAAIAAGVKRFLPSEFGSDVSNPLNAALPVFDYKVATRKHLEAAISKQEGEKMTYTYVINGPFLDWGLEKSFLINFKEPPVKLYDNGTALFSTTTLDTVGKAVVGILSHPKETENRNVFIEDLQITQKRFLELAEKITGKKYETVNVDTAALKKGSDEALAKGEVTPTTIVSYLFPAVFGGEQYGNPWRETDNKLLGLEERSEEVVEDVLKQVLA
jgi:nucleoside-diphosphate-sugar epimerase